MTTVSPRANGPYDDGIQDPYPTYARPRAEVPVFYNEEVDLFASIGFAALPTTVTLP